MPVNEVELQFLDIMTVLADSLFDPSLLAGLTASPYVLDPTPRFDKDGSRVLEFLSDGDWWKETSDVINSGGVKLGMRPKKVFPIIIYMDETHVTADGKFKATPVFCQAGNLSEEVRSKTDSWRFLGFIPQLNTPGKTFTPAQVYGVKGCFGLRSWTFFFFSCTRNCIDFSTRTTVSSFCWNRWRSATKTGGFL